MRSRQNTIQHQTQRVPSQVGEEGLPSEDGRDALPSYLLLELLQRQRGGMQQRARWTADLVIAEEGEGVGERRQEGGYDECAWTVVDVCC